MKFLLLLTLMIPMLGDDVLTPCNASNGPITDRHPLAGAVFAEPTTPRPTAGQPYTDPCFGSRITIVSDEPGYGVEVYFQPAFSRDSAFFYAHKESNYYIFAIDPANGTLRKNPDGSVWRYHVNWSQLVGVANPYTLSMCPINSFAWSRSEDATAYITACGPHMLKLSINKATLEVALSTDRTPLTSDWVDPWTKKSIPVYIDLSRYVSFVPATYFPSTALYPTVGSQYGKDTIAFNYTAAATNGSIYKNVQAMLVVSLHDNRILVGTGHDINVPMRINYPGLPAYKVIGFRMDKSAKVLLTDVCSDVNGVVYCSSGHGYWTDIQTLAGYWAPMGQVPSQSLLSVSTSNLHNLGHEDLGVGVIAGPAKGMSLGSVIPGVGSTEFARPHWIRYQRNYLGSYGNLAASDVLTPDGHDVGLLVSTYSLDSNSVEGCPSRACPWANELFLVNVLGERFVRLGHTRSLIFGGADYWEYPRASISPNGKWVVFTTNWGTPGSMKGSTFAGTNSYMALLAVPNDWKTLIAMPSASAPAVTLRPNAVTYWGWPIVANGVDVATPKGSSELRLISRPPWIRASLGGACGRDICIDVDAFWDSSTRIGKIKFELLPSGAVGEVSVVQYGGGSVPTPPVIYPDAVSVPKTGKSVPFTLRATDGHSFEVLSRPDWITVSGVSQCSSELCGNLTVLPNAGVERRSDVSLVMIPSGRQARISVSQDGAVGSVTPVSLNLPPAGGTSYVTINSPSPNGIAGVLVTSLPGWIQVSWEGSCGDKGRICVSVASNGGAQRRDDVQLETRPAGTRITIPVTQAGTAASFTAIASSSAISTRVGAVASFPILITPLGFSGPVTVSLAPPIPSNVTCEASTAMVGPSAPVTISLPCRASGPSGGIPFRLSAMARSGALLKSVTPVLQMTVMP